MADTPATGTGASSDVANADRGGGERMDRPVAGVLHTILVLAIVGGWSYLGVVRAGRMRAEAAPNRMAAYAITMAFEWIVFAIIYAGVRARGISMHDVFGRRWRGGKDFATDIGVALIFWVCALLILGITGRLLRITPEVQNRVFYLLPRTGAEMVMWVLLSITAGICEETIFRGYFQRQFIAWSKNTAVGVILSAALFGLGHSYQGGRQPILIGVFGLLFGILTVMRRSIKPGMMAHGLQDSVTGIVASIHYHLH